MRRSITAILLMLLFVGGVSLGAGAPFTMPPIKAREVTTIRTETGEILVETLSTVSRGGHDYYEVDSLSDNGTRLTMVMNPDLTPVSILHQEKDGTIIRRADYMSGRYHLVLPKDNTDKWIELPPGMIFDQQTLFYVLRGFPFEHPGTVDIELVVTNGTTVKVSINYMGLVETRVNGIQRKAYKLEMKPAGWVNIVYRARFYFYYDTQPPYRFIKYADSDGRLAESIGFGD